jgi:CBS-domain-containing membrane protein
MPLTNVTVEEFTTPDPVTANEDMSIDELRLLMDEHGIRHLPVMRDDTVVGVISDRDIRLVSGLSLAEKHQVRASDIANATSSKRCVRDVRKEGRQRHRLGCRRKIARHLHCDGCAQRADRNHSRRCRIVLMHELARIASMAPPQG